MNVYLTQAVGWVQQQPGTALLALGGAYLLLLLLVLFLAVRLVALGKKQSRLLRGADGASIERMLLEQVDSAQTVRNQIEQASRISSDNAAAIQACLQRIGLVRFDAFPDVGGEQSFALAVLDGASNGLVISGLYSRHDMRVYAKPVVGGSSPLSLTDEERKAISSAVSGGPVTQHTTRTTGGRK